MAEGIENANHIYHKLLSAADPVAQQPKKIKMELKAHQKAALAKAMIMEIMGCVRHVNNDIAAQNVRHRSYEYTGSFRVYTNVGILGDLVGHGKTLTALSIIAAMPTEKIFVEHETHHSFIDTRNLYTRAYTDEYRSGGNVRIVCEKTDEDIAREMEADKKFATTLIVVPRGPVFNQWRKAIETQTSLKGLVLDTNKCIKNKIPDEKTSYAQLHEFFNKYDCVLIKTTTLKQLNEYFASRPHDQRLFGFDRIIIDEAHDEIGSVPMMRYKFLWLVTSTYNMLGYKNYVSANYISNGVRHIFPSYIMSTYVIRGEDEFVKASFELPRMTEFNYTCKMNMVVAALHGFLSPNVQERLNVNDIAGAIKEMGGKMETEDELVRIVTAGMERDINNKKRELEYVGGLDMDEASKVATITRLQGELAKLEEKRTSLQERITALAEKQCAICMDNHDEPVMLACTHVFCGECIVDWMRVRTAHTSAAPACPTCRVPINTKNMVAVVNEVRQVPEVKKVEVDDSGDIGTNAGDEAAKGRFTKEDLLLRLIRRKPDGKWLIFTRVDNGFVGLKSTLQNAGISFAELKGNTAVMSHTLDNFSQGRTKVILLHTQYAGSGIDISCATDVIIYHSMGMSKIQAVGRAQRVGRTQPLTVHNLFYPNEITE